jgi:hypothetical protein
MNIKRWQRAAQIISAILAVYFFWIDYQLLIDVSLGKVPTSNMLLALILFTRVYLGSIFFPIIVMLDLAGQLPLIKPRNYRSEIWPFDLFYNFIGLLLGIMIALHLVSKFIM